MTIPFQGVRHGEISSQVHKNPESWHSLFFGLTIGKPLEKEQMCLKVLLHLGYTLSEIKELHDCGFDIQKFMEYRTDKTINRTQETASSTLRIEGSIPIPAIPQTTLTTSLLSYPTTATLEPSRLPMTSPDKSPALSIPPEIPPTEKSKTCDDAAESQASEEEYIFAFDD